MELASASKWLAYAIFSTVFAREVIVSFLKWRDGKGGYIYDVRSELRRGCKGHKQTVVLISL